MCARCMANSSMPSRRRLPRSSQRSQWRMPAANPPGCRAPPACSARRRARHRDSPRHCANAITRSTSSTISMACLNSCALPGPVPCSLMRGRSVSLAASVPGSTKATGLNCVRSRPCSCFHARAISASACWQCARALLACSASHLIHCASLPALMTCSCMPRRRPGASFSPRWIRSAPASVRAGWPSAA